MDEACSMRHETRYSVNFFAERPQGNRLLNPLSTKLCLSDLKTQFVPRSKHSASVTKTDKLMLYREIIAVCSEMHTKHINALCAEHRILNVKAGGI